MYNPPDTNKKLKKLREYCTALIIFDPPVPGR